MEGGTETPVCVLYAGPRVTTGDGDLPCRPAGELLADRAAITWASVLLVDEELVERIRDLHTLPEHAVVVAADARAAAALGPRAEISLAGIADPAARHAILHAACNEAIARFAVADFEAEFHELSRIGIALICEHDRKALLRLIVAQSKRLTHSDGGGLLLLSEDEDGTQWLRPVLYSFDSIDGEFIDPDVRVPVDETSIIGHSALTKQPMMVADAYDLPRSVHFAQNVEFDEQYGYRRRSMLVVPMLDQLHRVLGILVCVNRKTDPDARITSKAAADQYVIEYSHRELRLVRMLASQAAVAIENARLYAQIERAFESFVQAAVSAIDLRDPATAGHSLRVAALVTCLAEALEQKESGQYRNVRFTSAQMRELRFAALLHDIGKIAVSEDLLLKAKKLPSGGWERIDARFDLIARTMQLASCRAYASAASSRASGGNGTSSDPDEALEAQLKELERFRDVIHYANEPSVLDAPIAAELAAIAQRTYERPDGTFAPYLTAEELHYLQLPRGTLDDAERAEVEAHATASRDLLVNIPWTDSLKGLVEYAYGHHELLNGDGYPRHLSGAAIPLQTRLITIADVFDALTATDRPYKPAVPIERALEMLRAEAAAGRLDPELVEVMAETEPYRRPAARTEPEL
jgi:HD-GYP domain-containing protein (c-di-GMP phosphodiesterase class II)